MSYIHLEGQKLVLLAALFSPVTTFAMMALVKFIGQTLSLQGSEPFVLRLKIIMAMSIIISLGMTSVTVCVGVLWDVLLSNPIVWGNWLTSAGLTWLLWMLGTWIGLLFVAKIFGKEFFSAKE